MPFSSASSFYSVRHYQGQRYETSDEPVHLKVSFCAIFPSWSPGIPFSVLQGALGVLCLHLEGTDLLKEKEVSFCMEANVSEVSHFVLKEILARQWRLFTRLQTPLQGLTVAMKNKDKNWVMFGLQETLLKLLNTHLLFIDKKTRPWNVQHLSQESSLSNSS